MRRRLSHDDGDNDGDPSVLQIMMTVEKLKADTRKRREERSSGRIGPDQKAIRVAERYVRDRSLRNRCKHRIAEC